MQVLNRLLPVRIFFTLNENKIYKHFDFAFCPSTPHNVGSFRPLNHKTISQRNDQYMNKTSLIGLL